MTRVIIAAALLAVGTAGSDLDLFGYFEPQYNGMYRERTYNQIQSDKLRVDLLSKAGHVEVGANAIGVLFFGRTDWNLVDFLPEAIQNRLPPGSDTMFRFSYRDTFFLDNAYLRASTSWFAVTAGKQQLSFGAGYFANPTDLFNAKDALDPTYEQPGHNAIRLDFQLLPRLGATAIYGPFAPNWQESGKLVRLKCGIDRFDLSVLAVETHESGIEYTGFQPYRQRRRMLGGSLVGQIWEIGVWGEGGYSFLLRPNPDVADSTWSSYELLAGLDYTFDFGLHALAEYHRNSGSKRRDYALADWLAYFSGQTRTITREQVYGSLQYPVTDLFTVGVIAIYALDGSAAAAPVLQYNLFDNLDLTLMVNVFIGEEGRAYSSALGNGGFLRCRVWF